jgi:CPA2 family monovalent cation:H+ antiporter-2
VHAPAFLGPLALIFLAALAAAYVLHRLHQPPLIGFLVAGVLFGPFGLGLLRDVAIVEALADFGVVLLLFTIGLELSLSNLRRLGKMVWLAGTIQVTVTVALVLAIALAAHEPASRGLFFGYIVALSSTAIVLKLLFDRHEMDSPHGRALIGILIFQDLAVVPMMLSMPFLASGGSGGLPTFLPALLKTFATTAALVVIARFVIPRFIGALAGTRQKEIFVIAVLFLVLGSALATSWAGLSAALGAFLAGLVLSESEYGHQAMADVSGFRDAFNAVFFVSIGMLLNPRVILQEPVPVAVLLALILFWKTLAGAAAVLPFGYGVRIGVVVGLSLAQIGEFSFVLLRQGFASGLVSEARYQTFLAAAIVTMMATPFLSEISHAVALRVARGDVSPSRPAHASEPAAGLVLVIGYGHTGQTVARVLQRSKAPFRILDLDPVRVKKGVKQLMPIEYGDSTNDIVLRRAGVLKARAVIVLVSDPRAMQQTIRHCRSLNPALFILARARYVADIPTFAGAGADEVVAEEFETSLEIARRTVKSLGLPLPWVESETQEIRRIREEGFRATTDVHIPRPK